MLQDPNVQRYLNDIRREAKQTTKPLIERIEKLEAEVKRLKKVKPVVNNYINSNSPKK